MKRALLALLLVSVGGIRPAAGAEPVFAVFSSETGPYQEALKGLQQELKDVRPFFLTQGEPDIPASARVVVAFGAKAAVRKYPPGSALVYAMAPGTRVQAKGAVKVGMEPDHGVLLQSMKQMQPSLKRLGLFWMTPSFESYAGELREAARPFGIEIEGSRVEDGGDIPDLLRRSFEKVDAIWLVPDPLLINGETLPVFINFSRSNKVPLFASTGGLIDRGATAAIGPSFREMGRVAGVSARKALENQPQESMIYPANAEIAVNMTIASQIGLQIADGVLRKAVRVVP